MLRCVNSTKVSTVYKISLVIRIPCNYCVQYQKNFTIMKYFLGNPSGVTFDQVIEAGNSEHFSKLTCSIIPTVNYWRNLNNKIITEISSDDYAVCFEYPVRSIKGAKSSYTDVMLVSSETNICVESKWNEKKGVYCKNHQAKMKDEVQRHWLAIISNYIGKKLMQEDFNDIEYQLLHRVASACSLNKSNCVVVYQIFYTNNLSKSFVKEIAKIKSLLNTEKIKFYINSVKIQNNEAYTKLFEEIKLLDRSKKIDRIKNEIKRRDLFNIVDEDLILL